MKSTSAVPTGHIYRSRNVTGPGEYIGGRSALCNPYESHRPWDMEYSQPAEHAKRLEQFREWFFSQLAIPNSPVRSAIVRLVGNYHQTHHLELACFCDESVVCHGDIIAETVRALEAKL